MRPLSIWRKIKVHDLQFATHFRGRVLTKARQADKGFCSPERVIANWPHAQWIYY